MADVLALREFRYQDRQTRQVVTVRQGERLDPAVLGPHGVDVEKMIRTGYADRSEAVAVTPKRRGRPPKKREG